ncbi:hypothetical protein M569_04678, partial [Genlisea aurea]
QKRSLVNVKIPWVRNPVLDSVVSRDVELKAASTIVSLIGSHPNSYLPIHRIIKFRGQFGLPSDLKLSTFLRRYPSIFEEFYRPDSAGTPVPCYKLSSPASEIYVEEQHLLFQDCYVDILNRLQKLLMLTKQKLLPLQTIDQLRFDLGLPLDYMDKFVNARPDLFGLVELPDGREGVKLLYRDDSLAVSHLESKRWRSDDEEQPLAFPIVFTRGFGLKKKSMEWLHDWQKLIYTSPYADASHLDPRTDVSEKRIVGVFHELVQLTILKKMERKNVSNLRRPLGLPYKFSKVFGRHPWIFYISMKGDTQTVVLREGYDDRGKLIENHPLAGIRNKYASMMTR